MADSVKKQCSAAENTDKLRILALHGYRQNAETFRQKTGSFRKILHKLAQFTYVTAPHKVIAVENSDSNNLEIGQSKDDEQYGWFFNRDDHTYRGIRKGGPAIGFEESVNFIEEVFEKEGPFDGIFSFSQGACFTGLLCDLQQRGLINIQFNFAILVSGFKSGSLPHLKYYNDVLTLPTLHVFGETDQIIPTDMSATLASAFMDPIVVRHSGGHFVPATASQKQQYLNFIKLQQLKKDALNQTDISI